jgi:hypothetical protein
MPDHISRKPPHRARAKGGYELALTLRAMAATRYPSDEDFAAQGDPILERLA